MLTCGDTFLIEDVDGPECHLWIVITPPGEDEVVIVSVTTKRQKSETLVILKKGDHPFIEHDSVIAYKYSKVVTVESIETALKNGTAKRHQPASDSLLKRAQQGLLESDFTSHGVRSLFRIFMGL
jgi:mRNA-degrading endonuclease toxin of MazEF toxin-antitoxin module